MVYILRQTLFVWNENILLTLTFIQTKDCVDGVLGVVADDANVLDGVLDIGVAVVNGGFTSVGVWGILFSSVAIWKG